MTQYLIATIAGEDIALPTDRVESVVKATNVVPVPASQPSVAGLFALRSRVLTMIDCHYVVTGERHPAEGQVIAIVVELDGHGYGLIVDAVQDVWMSESDARALQNRPEGGWDRVGVAMLETEAKSYLVIDPERLVQPERRRAA